ncbi:hypothetical protein [Thiomonas sp.]
MGAPERIFCNACEKSIFFLLIGSERSLGFAPLSEQVYPHPLRDATMLCYVLSREANGMAEPVSGYPGSVVSGYPEDLGDGAPLTDEQKADTAFALAQNAIYGTQPKAPEQNSESPAQDDGPHLDTLEAKLWELYIVLAKAQRVGWNIRGYVSGAQYTLDPVDSSALDNKSLLQVLDFLLAGGFENLTMLQDLERVLCVRRVVFVLK